MDEEIKEQFIDNMFKKSFDIIDVDPRVLVKVRNCHNCGNLLSLGEYCDTNRDKDFQELFRLWGEKSVELYCCDCFHKAEIKEKIRDITKELPERICRVCQRVFPIESFMNLDKVDCYELGNWKDMDSALCCLNCIKEEDRLDSIEMERKLEEEGFTANDIIYASDLGLDILGLYKNGKEASKDDIIKSTDKIQLIIRNQHFGLYFSNDRNRIIGRRRRRDMFDELRRNIRNRP